MDIVYDLSHQKQQRFFMQMRSMQHPKFNGYKALALSSMVLEL